MSKLSPLHNNFPLTVLNEDFVMCITGDPENQPQTQQARLARVCKVNGLSHNVSYY